MNVVNFNDPFRDIPCPPAATADSIASYGVLAEAGVAAFLSAIATATPVDESDEGAVA